MSGKVLSTIAPLRPQNCSPDARSGVVLHDGKPLSRYLGLKGTIMGKKPPLPCGSVADFLWTFVLGRGLALASLSTCALAIARGHGLILAVGFGRKLPYMQHNAR